ncbi:MAG: hypothetical protein ACFFDW_00690 [Candidatus Thorarchaeota archaeon]
MSWNNIGLEKRIDETWKKAARRSKEKLVKEKNWYLPEICKTDKLIISHTHVPFYDMDNGIFATGAWTVKDELKEDKEYLRWNIGVFILIDDEDRNDPIKLIRWFEKKKIT